MADEDDLSSLVDEVFGKVRPKKAGADPETEAAAEAAAAAEDEPLAAASPEPEGEPEPAATEEPAGETASADAPASAGVAAEAADSANENPAADEPAPSGKSGSLSGWLRSKVPAGSTGSAAIPGGAGEPADSGGTDAADEKAAAGDSAPAPAKTTPLRGRLIAAASVGFAAVLASVLVLSGGGKSSGSATPPGGTPATTEPSVNPQAFYPATQNETPFETGPTDTVLTDALLQAAVPGCGDCKLVTRANGFSPDGAVLALFRTGDPVIGKPNFKLVVVGADGKLVWSAPDGVQALTAGIERFYVDKAGNFYLALPGSRTGYMLIVLNWQGGKVVDVGDLLHPKVFADAVVGILPEPTPGATATIVAQTRNGVPDAMTGGLIESQYQVRDGVPVLIGCRRHVGESGEWVPFAPDPAKGCGAAPAGPVGPPDGDGPTLPVATTS